MCEAAERTVSLGSSLCARHGTQASEASSHASTTTSQEVGALVDASVTEMRRQKLTEETQPAQDTWELGRIADV